MSTATSTSASAMLHPPSEITSPTSTSVSTFAAPVGPLLFLAGSLTSSLAVRSISARSILDERSATLSLHRTARLASVTESARLRSLIHQPVTIAQPIALPPADGRLLPLFAGSITHIHSSESTDEITLTARCHWSQLLDLPVDSSTASSSASSSPATLAQALALLSETTDLALDTALLEPAHLDAPLLMPMSRSTLRAALESLLGPARLFVHRDLLFHAGSITEHRTLRPLASSRRLPLPSRTLAVTTARVTPPVPTRFIALAQPQIVESTFTLLPAWDPAHQNQPDAQYAKSTSSDFDSLANVFRLWLLNEDASLPAPAAPFDLSSLFDEDRSIPPTPLPFRDCLTLDAAGRSVGIIIELSTDAGSTFTRYPAAARILPDRAGIYLDDDTLPPSLIAAVRLNHAHLRVTASLRSPLPTTAIRWRGNPFLGPFATHHLDTRSAFHHRRVAPTSRFHPDHPAATLLNPPSPNTADVADDRAALAAHLAHHASAAAASHPATTSQHTFDLPRLTLTHRPGDQLAPSSFDNHHNHASAHTTTLIDLHLDFARHRSTLTCQRI